MKTKLQTHDILKDFHRITGARVSLHDLDNNEIAAYPEELSAFCQEVQKNEKVRARCYTADATAFKRVRETGEKYTYKCHCGLIETVAPIYSYGVLTGYFMMGQITDDQSNSIPQIEKSSEDFFKNATELKNHVASVPVLKAEMLDSYINILEVLAEYMTETNRLTAKDRDLPAAIKSYIHRFYQHKISVELLCDTFNCSRTTLMNRFREKYGKTIVEYLTEYRLKKAADMLSDGAAQIKNVSIDCGFLDQNYFTKVFQKHFGKTPSEYRTAVKPIALQQPKKSV